MWGCGACSPFCTPLVVVVDEDSMEGRSKTYLITGFHLWVLQRRLPLGQSYDLGKPWGQGRTNKPSLSIPPSYPRTTIPPSPSLTHSTYPGSLNKGMLSLSALGSKEETYKAKKVFSLYKCVAEITNFLQFFLDSGFWQTLSSSMFYCFCVNLVVFEIHINMGCRRPI